MNAEARSKQIRGCGTARYIIDPLSLRVFEYNFYPDTGQMQGPFRTAFEEAR